MSNNRLRALLVCVCLWCAAPAWAAVTVVQSGTDADDNTGNTSTVNVTASAGDAIFVGAGVEGTETCSISDDKANTYSTQVTLLHTNNSQRICLRYALNVAAGSTTVTLTTSANQYRWLCVALVRNVRTSMAEDDSDTSQGTDTAVAGPTVAASTAGIALAVYGAPGQSSITENASWTLMQENENNSFNTGSCVYQLTAAGNYAASWTQIYSTDYVVATVVLKEVAAAGGTGKHRSLLGVGH